MLRRNGGDMKLRRQDISSLSNDLKTKKKTELREKSRSSWKAHPLPSSKQHKLFVSFVGSSMGENREKACTTQSLDKILSENDPDLLVREYFIAPPSLRPRLRQFTAKHINSVGAVLEVLNWSRKKGVQEAYDSAIALLAECGEILLKVANTNAIKNPTSQSDISNFEEQWEVLIKSIACACNINPEQRFDTITKLIPLQTKRLVKTAIIDALSIMQDEIDADSIYRQLEYFLSSKESDKYIQDYVNETIKEIF